MYEYTLISKTRIFGTGHEVKLEGLQREDLQHYCCLYTCVVGEAAVIHGLGASFIEILIELTVL